MSLRQRSLNDRADGVDHIPAGQIESRGDLRLSRWFLVSLLLHDLSAGQSKLNARIGMDTVRNSYLNHTQYHAATAPDYCDCWGEQ